MHECPDCSQACACDIEDTWFDDAPSNCEHECDQTETDEDYDYYPVDDEPMSLQEFENL